MLGASPVAVVAGGRRCRCSGRPIVAAASIVFLFTFTSFGVVLLLGGPQHSDPRGRDLPPDRAAARPRGRGRAGPPAARRRRRAPLVTRPLAGTARGRPPAAAPRRGQRRAPRHGPARAARRQPRRDGDPARAAARGLVERSFATPGGYGLDWYRALAVDGHGRMLFVPPGGGDRATRCVFALRRHVHRRRCSVGSRPSRSPRPAHADAARHGADAAARHLGRDRRLRLPHHPRRAAARPAGSRRSSSRSRKPSSRCRSSCASSFPCCARSTPGCGRRPPCSARRRRARGGRSTCRSCRAPLPWAPASPSPSRSASSAPRCSSPARTPPRFPIAIFRLLGPPGRGQLRAGHGDGDDPHGVTVAVLARVRARSALGDLGDF